MGRFLDFFRKTIWQTHAQDLPPFKAVITRLLRVVALTFRKFPQSNLELSASALTYYSLLSIVPILAIIMGIAKGFNLEKLVEKWLLQTFKDQSTVVSQLINFAEASLKQAEQNIIAGMGLLLLLWSVIKILKNIEDAFNSIWNLKGGRSYSRQFSDYLAIILIAPIFILVSSGLNVYLTTQLNSNELLATLHPVIKPILGLSPFILTWLLFTFLYSFIPNTKVRFSSALVAGIATGTIYQLMQWVYLYFQMYVTSYNAVYGAFAALPLFLIWLQLSWLIVLMGAKISFAHQHVDAYEYMHEDFHLSHRFKILLELKILHFLIQGVQKENPPPSLKQMAEELRIPAALLKELLNELTVCNILICFPKEHLEDGVFVPAKDINRLTIKNIIDMIEEKGEAIPMRPSYDVKQLMKHLYTFDKLIRESSSNIPLKDL